MCVFFIPGIKLLISNFVVTSLLFRNVTTTYNIAVIEISNLPYTILLYELQEHNYI